MKVRLVGLLAVVLIGSMFVSVPAGSASTLYLWDCKLPANKNLAECKSKHTPVPTEEVVHTPEATPVPTVVVTAAPTIVPVVVSAAPVSAAPAASGSSSPDNHASWIKVCAWQASTSGGTYSLVSRESSTKNVATLSYVENHIEGQDYLPYKNMDCAATVESVAVATSVPSLIEVEATTTVPAEVHTEVVPEVVTVVPVATMEEFVPETVPAPNVPAAEDEAPLPVMPLGLPNTGDGSTYNPDETP